MSKSKDAQANIVEHIISELKNGTKPWVKPWTDSLALPHSQATKQIYSGINCLILWCRQERAGFTSSAWMTYKQANALGGQVRKGEKSITCFYFSKLEVDDKGTGETKHFPYRKCFSLFNLDQIDGIDSRDNPLPIHASFEPIKSAEALLACSGARIKHGANTACYQTSVDAICMPDKTSFHSPEDYYATVLHELVHWTGHSTRLSRNIISKFGSEGYAFEELVAEMGSAFLCAELGIQGQLQHASYIDNWLKLLSMDGSALFRAATLASSAHRYLIDLLKERETVSSDVASENVLAINAV